ncbi:MAG: hypothetical protein EHM55_12200 [Acidobacteria bacterium]|nr:MAG: hypothetical protein EHM55_12200 [Acidobacteriota bacterium]
MDDQQFALVYTLDRVPESVLHFGDSSADHIRGVIDRVVRLRLRCDPWEGFQRVLPFRTSFGVHSKLLFECAAQNPQSAEAILEVYQRLEGWKRRSPAVAACATLFYAVLTPSPAAS